MTRSLRNVVDGAAGFVQDVEAEEAVSANVAELAEREQIDSDVILENVDVFLRSDSGQQGAFDFAAGDVSRVEDATFAVTAFAPEVELVAASGKLALVEGYTEVDEFADARGAIGNDRADDLFVAQSGAGIERVAHVQLEGVLAAGDAGDSALRP